MTKEFVFEDVTITESDITDGMIREECIAYLLNRVNVSKYLRENITVAESERLNAWIKGLDADKAVALILGEAGAKETLKKAAAAAAGAGKKVGGAAVGAGKAVGKSAVAAGKAVGGAGKAVGGFAKAHPYKAAVIGAGAVAAGIGARALYKRLTDQCVKQCKGSADPECVVKCRQAAKAKVATA